MINVEKTIISQYGNSPTISQLILFMNDYIDPRADLDTFFDYVWNVDTAQGFGLDIWGRIVNVERLLNVPADTPNPGAYTFTPGNYQLNDTQYRRVILAKALANITNGSAASLNQLLSNLFVGRGRCYVNDMGAMTMRLTFEFYLEPYEYVMMLNSGVTPRNAGVLLTLLQVLPSGTFGFSQNLILQPFNQGTFYTH